MIWHYVYWLCTHRIHFQGVLRVYSTATRHTTFYFPWTLRLTLRFIQEAYMRL